MKNLGFTDLADLLDATTKDLAAGTGVHRSTANRWLEIARLEQHVPWAEGGDRLALLSLLLASGVGSPATFDPKAADRDGFYSLLVKAAEDTQLLPVKSKTVDRW